MNNYEQWHHIATAPKDREVLVWDGESRIVARWNIDCSAWGAHGMFITPTHWRGCPPPPVKSLPDDPE